MCICVRIIIALFITIHHNETYENEYIQRKCTMASLIAKNDRRDT